MSQLFWRKIVGRLPHKIKINSLFGHVRKENQLSFWGGIYSPDYDNCSNVQYVNKQPRRLREGDFGSNQDLDHWPPPHDSSSGGDSVYRFSAIPCVSFRSNSFTIRRPSPMLVQKKSIPGHGDSDSLGISTSTRLPDAALQDPAMDLASIIAYNVVLKIPQFCYKYILM